MSRIITIGEPLGMFSAAEKGELRNVETFKRYVSGAELAYAVGMARLGYEVSYVTKVGNDPLGMHILDFLRSEKISTDYLDILDTYATGIELKTNSVDGWPDLHYYRNRTAATTLSTVDINQIDFSQFDHLHLTGIPIALSQSCRQAAMEMIYQAHQHNITVSFEPNLRARLWDDEIEMTKILNGITILCDIIFPEIFEAQKLLGTDDPDKIADFYIGAGVKTVVIKMGDRGFFVKNKRERFWADPYPFKTIVDRMGVGDGFCVGVTSALLEGRTLQHAIERGRLIGAKVAEGETMYDALPYREELISLVKDFYHYNKEDEHMPGPLPDTEIDNLPSEAAREAVKLQVNPVEEVNKEEFVPEEEEAESLQKLKDRSKRR